MKTLKIMPLLMATLMVVLLASCGPSYVGVNTRPAYGYYGRPYGYYGGFGYGNPYGYYRPPVIVQRRTYITPAPRYSAPRNYTPNGRIGGGGFNGGGFNGGGRSRGPR